MEAQESGAYAERLGEQLRNVRQQQGLSLQDVEAQSQGELKASVVGAYERGERAVSVTRLRALADFYRVPINELVPGDTDSASAPARRSTLRVDLTRLGESQVPTAPVVRRYLTTIQARRGDYNGRVLTIRDADLSALSAILDLPAQDLREQLIGAGVAAETR